MAIPIAKQLITQGYVVPVNLDQRLNYNRIKRNEIECKKDISFVHRADSESPKSASSSASSISADGECKDLGISFVHAKNGGSKGASSNSAIPAKKGCKKSDSVLRSDIFPLVTTLRVRRILSSSNFVVA